MVATTTSKGLILPAEEDNYELGQFNANAQRLNDFGMGFVVCTSTTRPASPWVGLQILETDTEQRLVFLNGAWVPLVLGTVLKVNTATERAAITSPYGGQTIYRYDRDWIETWTGAAWRVQGVAVCSSASDRTSAITNPYSGQLAITTDTDTLWQYDGSSATWVPSPRGLIARGRRTTASASTTSIVGVLRIGDSGTIPVVSGRAYRISAVVHPRSTVAGDRIVSEIRYTTNGTTPTTTSPILAQKYSTAVGVDSADTDPFEMTYEPGSSHSLRLLLTVSLGVGTGTVQMYADATASTELVVEDIGLAVGDTGVDI